MNHYYPERGARPRPAAGLTTLSACPTSQWMPNSWLSPSAMESWLALGRGEAGRGLGSGLGRGDGVPDFHPALGAGIGTIPTAQIGKLKFGEGE